MPGAARLNDTITGEFTVEHHGHYINGAPVHPSGSLTGVIKHGCSSNVFINGMNAATIGCSTDDSDACCNAEDVVMHSTILGGSSKVFINGISAARIGDSVIVHCDGTANISSGSDNVNIL